MLQNVPQSVRVYRADQTVLYTEETDFDSQNGGCGGGLLAPLAYKLHKLRFFSVGCQSPVRQEAMERLFTSRRS